jgi:hypothetical protein
MGLFQKKMKDFNPVLFFRVELMPIEAYITRCFTICTSHQTLFGDELKKNKMSRACSTHGKKMLTGFWWGKMRERDHLEDIDGDGSIILK